MSVYRLIYVSPAMADGETFGHAAQFGVASAARHAWPGVSGIVLLCRGRLVGALEGDRAVVAGMMDQIRRDPRHTGAVIVDDGLHDERIFAGWSLAYAGRSMFIATIIDRALEGLDGGVHRLLDAIREFAGGENGGGSGGGDDAEDAAARSGSSASEPGGAAGLSAPALR